MGTFGRGPGQTARRALSGCDLGFVERDPVAAALAGGPPAMFLLTGIQAAGKSTVRQLLAERFPRSVHVRGDLYRRMVVNGRLNPVPSAGPEVAEPLRLRHRLAAAAADGYHRAGFTAVLQDCFLGEMLPFAVSQLRSRPLWVVVLAPSAEVVARREAGSSKNAYREWTVEMLDRILRAETPRLGLWLDSSEQTPQQTVDEILSRTGATAGVR